MQSLPERPVTPGEAPADVQRNLDAERSLPGQGADTEQLLDRASEDIRLSRELLRRLAGFPDLQPLTQSLSIATFRCAPRDLDSASDEVRKYLDELNKELLTRLQNSSQVYLSNAVVNGKFALRACIVNFRTSLKDIEALLPLVVRTGKDVDFVLRPQTLPRGHTAVD